MLLPRRIQARMGALPMLTNAGDQTKNHVVLHVESPTKPYRIRARGANTIGAFGLVQEPLPTLTNHRSGSASILLVLLPIITGRGVKYTHNDIKHRILHPDSGPTRIRLIPQASDQKKVVVGDGGAKHRSIDPPTTWHSVADPHAVATIPRWPTRPGPHDHPMLGVRPNIRSRSKQFW